MNKAVIFYTLSMCIAFTLIQCDFSKKHKKVKEKEVILNYSVLNMDSTSGPYKCAFKHFKNYHQGILTYPKTLKFLPEVDVWETNDYIYIGGWVEKKWDDFSGNYSDTKIYCSGRIRKPEKGNKESCENKEWQSAGGNVWDSRSQFQGIMQKKLETGSGNDIEYNSLFYSL